MDLTNRLSAQVSSFLSARLDSGRPVILGLSGGPDSMALFHLLLAYRRKGRLDLRIAHVDHRWRAESADEAELLKKYAQEANLPFYVRVLDGGRPERNAEDAARQARLAFFGDLCTTHGSQAVLLAHHADDLAETTLKRIFEGASLSRVSSMQAVSTIGSVTLWRPLLYTRKRDILAWLEQKGIVAFEDSTNSDPQFLRSRMRQNLLPLLSAAFGKEVAPTLCSVAEECRQFGEYIERQLQPWILQIVTRDNACSLDLSEVQLDRIEVKYLIRLLCEKQGFVLSRQALDTACDLFLEGKRHRQVAMGKNILHIDGRRLVACSV